MHINAVSIFLIAALAACGSPSAAEDADRKTGKRGVLGLGYPGLGYPGLGYPGYPGFAGYPGLPSPLAAPPAGPHFGPGLAPAPLGPYSPLPLAAISKVSIATVHYQAPAAAAAAVAKVALPAGLPYAGPAPLGLPYGPAPAPLGLPYGPGPLGFPGHGLGPYGPFGYPYGGLYGH